MCAVPRGTMHDFVTGTISLRHKAGGGTYRLPISPESDVFSLPLANLELNDFLISSHLLATLTNPAKIYPPPYTKTLGFSARKSQRLHTSCITTLQLRKLQLLRRPQRSPTKPVVFLARILRLPLSLLRLLHPDKIFRSFVPYRRPA